MVVTTTFISFTLLAIGVTFCGWKFLSVFKKSGHVGSKIGLLISIFFFLSALQNGILGLGALIFPKSPNKLYSFLLLSHFALALMAISSIYLLYYVLLPKQSPTIGIVSTSLLGLLFIFYTISTQPRPFLTVQNGIDWGMNTLLSILMFCLFFLSLAPPTYIFFKIFLSTNNKKLRSSALLISGLCAAGILNVFIRLVVLSTGSFTLRTRFLDIFVAFIGIGFIIFVAVLPFFQGLRSALRNKNFDRLDI